MALPAQEMIGRIVVAFLMSGIGVVSLTISVIVILSTFKGA